MPSEIERKFLVTGDFPRDESTEITQGYLSLDPLRTIRVRAESGKAMLNIKGKTVGITRAEFEYSIPLDEAETLLKLSLETIIEKTRYRVRQNFHTWEIDVFKGANEGLIVAEIELQSEAEEFEKPEWLGEEVSTDPRYTNARLATTPFKAWK
jgi:adenylate cyclase